MLTHIGYTDLVQMLIGVIEIIRLKNEDLSRLDAVIGDGDHGITMLRAMEQVRKVIDANPTGEISKLLDAIGWTLMGIDGGATGPLYGSLFIGMSEATVGVNTLAGKDLARMLEGGLASLEEQTKARIGDKTMMDALIPAVLTLRTSADQNKDISTMLKDAAEAALNGAQATSLIPARYGRAKFQGERTIGYPDPGSISMALVFQGFCNGLEKS